MGRKKQVEVILKHPKFDCFAYHGGKCTITLFEDCDGCRFYKTKERFEADAKGAKSK